MKINQVITNIELSVEDLTRMLSAANVAGYMEEKEKIVIHDDQEMASAILDAYSFWLNSDVHAAHPNWLDYVSEEFVNRFGTQKGAV